MSSPALLGGIFTPLITKSSMPKGLKLALALSISLAEVMVPEVELLEVVKVKLVPGLSAVKNNSPAAQPALAVTFKSLSALIKLTNPSRTVWGVKPPAVVAV